jgi:uncharacterized protein YprB with RNaseH-like and TPR domain
MAKVPVHRLLKKEMVWLGTHYCKHRVTYLEHYNCYLKEHADHQPKEAYLDIETTNLKASYGIMLCWCLYDATGEKMYEDCITKSDLQGKTLDKRVVSSLVDTLRKFDRVYTFYGTKFDIPFARTRAVVHGLDFPIFQSVKHKDVYYIVRNKFCLHSNRLAVACEILLGETDKTRIDPGRWTKALMGDKEALAYILEHCEYDVKDLAKLHRKVIDFAGQPNTSI